MVCQKNRIINDTKIKSIVFEKMHLIAQINATSILFRKIYMTLNIYLVHVLFHCDGARVIRQEKYETKTKMLMKKHCVQS